MAGGSLSAHKRKPGRPFGLSLSTGLRPNRLNPALAATKHPTSFDIVWAAGIYEGEGTISRKPVNRRGGTEVVSVSQKDPWILYRLREFFGGSVGIRLHGGGGKYRKHPMAHWNICGARARGFAMTIYKLLSPWRKAQICRALGVKQ